MAQDTNNNTVSPQLDELVCDLIGAMLDEMAHHPVDGVVVSLQDADGAMYQAQISEDGEEACLVAAHEFVASAGKRGMASEGLGQAIRYAVAYCGCVQDEQEVADALLVSFGERGMTCAYSAYLLIDNIGAGDEFVWSEPEPAGEEPLLL